MRFFSERSLLDTEIIYSCKQRRGKYTQKKGGVALKLKSLHFKPEETAIMSSRTCPTVGPRGGESSSSLGLGTQLTQLELFADLVWILSDPASVNRPRIDHRGIGEPAGSGRPHDEPKARNMQVRSDLNQPVHPTCPVSASDSCAVGSKGSGAHLLCPSLETRDSGARYQEHPGGCHPKIS